MKIMQSMLSSFDSMERDFPTKYSGKYEGKFLIYSLLIFTINRILILGSGVFNNQTPLFELFFPAIINATGLLLVMAIATPIGDQWIRKKFDRQQAATLLPLIPVGWVIFYYLIGSLFNNSIVLTDRILLGNLFWDGSPWGLGLMVGCLNLFIGLRTVILYGMLREQRVPFWAFFLQTDLRQKNHKFVHSFYLLLLVSPFYLWVLGLSWYSLFAPLGFIVLFSIAKAPFLNRNKNGLTIGDVLSAGFAAGILSLLQPIMPLLWAFSMAAVGIIIFYTTDLGREHFYYSYVPQHGREIPEIIDLCLIVLCVFIPLALLVEFIHLENLVVDVDVIGLLEKIGTWVYIVGITEEMIFRCGLLILFADGIKFWASRKEPKGFFKKIASRPYFSAMLLSSVLFGLAHAPKGWNYAFLAMIASLAYSYPYVKNKNFFGPIMLHAFVDVIAVAFFHAPL